MNSGARCCRACSGGSSHGRAAAACRRHHALHEIIRGHDHVIALIAAARQWRRQLVDCSRTGSCSRRCRWRHSKSPEAWSRRYMCPDCRQVQRLCPACPHPASPPVQPQSYPPPPPDPRGSRYDGGTVMRATLSFPLPFISPDSGRGSIWATPSPRQREGSCPDCQAQLRPIDHTVGE